MAKFKLLAETSDVKIVLNGRETDCIMIAEGGTVDWEVSAEGYVTQSGSEVVNEDTTKEIYLLLQDITIKIVPNVEGAKVVINGAETDEYTGKYGEKVTWEVSAEDYETATGEEVLSEDKEVAVTLRVNPFIFVYEYNEMQIVKGTATTTSQDSLIAIDGLYDIEINGVLIEGQGEATTNFDEYLNESGNIIKIYPHDGVTINHRSSGSTSSSNAHLAQSRWISEIQSWGGCKYGLVNRMFTQYYSGYSLLKTIPKFSKGFAEVESFEGMFYYMDSLVEIPEGLLDNCPKVTGVSNMFFNTGLVKIPSGLFDNCPGLTSIYNLFCNCRSLEEIPSGLFENCPDITDASYAFRYCSVLTAIPENLFRNQKKITTFAYTFGNCSALTSESAYDLVEIDGVETKIHLYERENYPDIFTTPTATQYCYSSDTKLADYSEIPNCWTSRC